MTAFGIGRGERAERRPRSRARGAAAPPPAAVAGSHTGGNRKWREGTERKGKTSERRATEARAATEGARSDHRQREHRYGSPRARRARSHIRLGGSERAHSEKIGKREDRGPTREHCLESKAGHSGEPRKRGGNGTRSRSRRVSMQLPLVPSVRTIATGGTRVSASMRAKPRSVVESAVGLYHSGVGWKPS